MAWGNQYSYNQPVMQQPLITPFINVPSEEVAYNWRVEPNTSKNFINEKEGYAYIKSVGSSILEPFLFEVYQLVKIGDNRQKEGQIQSQDVSNTNVDLSDYITKSEFEAYKESTDKIASELESNRGLMDEISKFLKEWDKNG